MPDDKDNVVPFGRKPKGESAENPQSAAKKEMLERLAEGSRRMRKRIVDQHVFYYVTMFMMIITLLAWAAWLE